MSSQTTTRRKVANALFGLLAFLAIFASLVTLVALLIDVVARGGSSVDLQFFTSAPSRIPAKAGILPALVGTLWVTTLVAIMTFPIGVAAAIYLEEYAGRGRWSRLLRINISNLAGVPSIVYGFFAITVITPLLKATILPDLGTFSALSAGIVVGILVLPLVASLTEDALRAVPRGLREGSYALGATRWETVRRVLLPAALSGIAAAVILAMSRAVGETMAVVLAAGTNPQLTLNPTESVQTMTAFIVQISLGDTPTESIQFKALFAVGATLFAITFTLNLISAWLVSRYRNVYE
jgi:phosphate transport system permease protein